MRTRAMHESVPGMVFLMFSTQAASAIVVSWPLPGAHGVTISRSIQCITLMSMQIDLRAS